MEAIKVQRGDVFCGRNPMALGRIINAVQRFWASDSESTYSHAGIILDSDGTTLEALWSVKHRNIFQAYAGEKILIARPAATPLMKDAAIKRIIKEDEGDRYPLWRLPMFLFPPAARIGFFGWWACSEITGKYLHYAECRHEHFKGTNPDTLADEWRNWRNFSVIYEGSLPDLPLPPPEGDKHG